MDEDAAYWEHVRRTVDEAPPLTAEQVEVIRAAFSNAVRRMQMRDENDDDR